MQPAQLSLLPAEFPTPPQVVLAELPEADVTEAIMLLARLIAKAATEGEVPADE
jgi:hypothetical protein